LFFVCLLLLFGSFGFLSPDGPGLPGAAWQPLTFFASPKKVSKERRPLVRSPFEVPGVGRYKSGGKINSLRSDKFSLFIRFAPVATGYSQADFETGSLRIALRYRDGFFLSGLINSVVPANAGTQRCIVD